MSADTKQNTTKGHATIKVHSTWLQNDYNKDIEGHYLKKTFH